MAFGIDDLIGYLAGKGSRDRAGRQLTANREEWEQYNPNVGATEFGKVAVDPATRNAQMAALNQLSGIAGAGGMDPGSVAALKQAQMANAQQAQARQQAVLQQAQAQGRLTGGRALSAQMQAEQGAANANAMSGAQAAADARSRALQAIANQGQLAGSIHGQDYGEAANKAQAQDIINRYNSQAGMAKQEQLANANRDLANFNLGNTQAIGNIAQGFGNAVSTAAKGFAGL